MRTSLKDVEEKIKPLGNKTTYDKEVIFDLLAAYGRAPGNITRLRNGQLNVADDKSVDVAQKGTVYFKPVEASDDELYAIVDDLKTDPTAVRYSTRFVIVTNYRKLLAIDTRTNEPLDIDLREIDKHYTFFLPWAGMEKAQFIAENHADVKAAEKMAKLFDILIEHNGYTTALEWHNLTTFFTRLLFCFFAEDTNIFQKNQFSNAIGSFTQPDGSDLKDFLKILFASLDDADKAGYPAHLAAFPYVNGQLFSNFSQIPSFNKAARDLLLESASKLDWSDINPDIFGSMFQAVVRPGNRTGLGQHYTSVPNIMKTIEPLFLDELKDELNNSYDDVRKLEKLLGRIGAIKIFDPACGSGNFLIIAYKELRRLEHAILERQSELTGQSQQVMLGSRVNIENFYGIEIDDFPHEVAILSLWLAKHQMNLEFSEKFGIDLPLIPLKESGHIVHANAVYINWTDVCPRNSVDEVYLIGNPPYLGSSMQSPEQKKEMAVTFSSFANYKNLDYISIWFKKAADYIDKTNSKVALVSTNSICQGDQVALLWPYILDSLEILYAYAPFKWTNGAKGNAGVTCVIISLGVPSKNAKYIYDQNTVREVTHINAYLAQGGDIIVSRRGVSISGLTPMVMGNKATDGGHFMLDTERLHDFVTKYPEHKMFIKKVIGADELLNGLLRYCFWIPDDKLEQALSNPVISSAMEAVRVSRLASKAESTRAYAKFPNRFRQINHQESSFIIIPCVTSERRKYLPVGYGDGNSTIVIAPNLAIYNPEGYIFGILSSTMHLVWTRAVTGQLESRIRYSSAIAYNNFPVPLLTSAEKTTIEERALAILDARENHPEKTLAELYDPDKMPEDLRKVHEELDFVVDTIYRKRPFENDEERLAHLFELYETMTASERKKS